MAKMTPEKVNEFIDKINPDIAEKGLKVVLAKKGEKLVSEEDSKKMKDILSREQTLIENEKSYKADFEGLDKKKADIEAREIAVQSQEKAFEAVKKSLMDTAAEVARKKAELLKNAEELAAGLYSERLAAVEADVQKIVDAARESAEKIRAEAYSAAEEIRKEANLEKTRIINQAQEDAQQKVNAAKSDTELLKGQIKQLINEKAELSGKNTELQAQNADLIKDKEALQTQIKNQKDEFDGIASKYKTTMDSYSSLNDLLNLYKKDAKTFAEEIVGLNNREQTLNELEDDLNKKKLQISLQERRNKTKEEKLELRKHDIEEEIEGRWKKICADKDEELELLRKEGSALREALTAKASLVASFDNLKALLGDKNPAEVLLDYQRVQQELALAVQKVNEIPSYVLQKTAEELKQREDYLKERESQLEQDRRDFINQHDDYANLQTKCDDLLLQIYDCSREKNMWKDRVEQLRSMYENPKEREARIEAINKPFVVQSLKRRSVEELTEISWLDDIERNIKESGLYFPRRILEAFHTALKTSEMSPLTVLAGVSGTGKSELPRLYSRFGGINFLSVPVQPNWDCQEAMLGYYNSIENCFEPTDMLRVLAQSQREPSKDNGFNDCVTMILLDEMNLANVELYFADFLSKLETRRGLADDDPNFPYIGVKVGSKMDNFPLRLGRNVLWTGTMNNDETTKTLSDKVIDRGIVINFPRPKKLMGSRKNTVLAEPADLLPRSVWSMWVTNAYKFEGDAEKRILEYKGKVEQINDALGRGGRALGHRVWQSIEYYMSLYPSVIAAQNDRERHLAMDRAFEDQLVQKVMPKLRGLETRGAQGEVLKTIKDILPETLHDDFNNAVKQNYGQFIWTTSSYLLRDDNSGNGKAEKKRD